MKSLDLVTDKGQDVWFDVDRESLKLETGCGFKDILSNDEVKKLYFFLKDNFDYTAWEEQQDVRS